MLFIVVTFVFSTNSFCMIKKEGQHKIALKQSVQPIGEKECAHIVLGCALCAKGAICCAVHHSNWLGVSCCAFGLLSYLSSRSPINNVKHDAMMNRD